MSRKGLKHLLYVITIILCISFTLFDTSITAYAGIRTDEQEANENPYGSLIDTESEEYKKIYNNTADEDSKIEGQSDADASKPGWIESAVSTVFGFLGQAGKWVLSLLGVSIDGIVLGRMSPNGIEVSKYFQFDMVKGNYPVDYAAKTYAMLRSNIFFFLLVGFLCVLLRYSFASVTPQVINDLKSKLSWIIISLFLLLALPNLFEIFLLLRDSFSYGVMNKLTGGNLGNLNIVMWSYDLWDDKKTIANCIIYIASILITGWFAVVYFVLAWMTAFLFSVVPVVLIYGIFDKTVWKNWMSLTAGNILCVFVDRILLCIPTLFPMPDGNWLDLNSIMRIASCGIIIPLRTAILNLFKFNMSYTGLGTAFAMMQAARDVSKGIGNIFKKAVGGIKNAKENYDGFKADKQLAKEELELAKAEGDGDHGIPDSYKQSGRKTGLERVGTQESTFSKYQSPAEDNSRGKSSDEFNESTGSLQAKDDEKKNSAVTSVGLDMNSKDRDISLSKEIDTSEDYENRSNGTSKDYMSNNLGLGAEEASKMNKDGITPADEINNETPGEKDNYGLDDIKNNTFASNKRLDNMIKKEKTSERMADLANDTKHLQDENKALSNERRTVMEDIARNDRAYAGTRNELQDKLNSVDNQLNNPEISQRKKNQLLSEKNNITGQLESEKAKYNNDNVALQGRLGQINQSMSQNMNKIKDNTLASQSLESDLNRYNQKEQIYGNMSGAVKASNSTQLESGLKKQEIMNKYVNDKNFESSRYQSALSHQQKAELYLERANRKKHNLIVQGSKDAVGLAGSTIGAVSGATIGASVGLAVGGNAMTAVAGASMLGSLGNVAGTAAGTILGAAGGQVASHVGTAAAGAFTNKSVNSGGRRPSGGSGNSTGSYLNQNAYSSNNDFNYQDSSTPANRSSEKVQAYTDLETNQLRSKIARENSIMQEEIDKELQNKRRNEMARDAEIKNLVNDIVHATKGN